MTEQTADTIDENKLRMAVSALANQGAGPDTIAEKLRPLMPNLNADRVQQIMSGMEEDNARRFAEADPLLELARHGKFFSDLEETAMRAYHTSGTPASDKKDYLKMALEARKERMRVQERAGILKDTWKRRRADG